MKAISIGIIFNNPDTSELNTLGLDVDLDECDIREMTFYNISAISPYLEDSKNYTVIH